MRSGWLSLQCFGECRIITILQQKVLFSLLTFSIAKKRLRQWDEGCDPYPSDNLVMTWLVPVYVHLLFLLVRIPPWKLTCPPKRDHFFKDMDHLRTINFQGIFVGSMVGGWWFMWKFSWRPAHTVAITERRKPLGFISKPFKRRYPLFLSCCTFCKNLHLLNHHPEFFILFWRDIYHDSDGRTEINFRKVLVQCFMLVSRLKSRHMLHDMAIAKSNSRWWFQISFVLSLLWGNDPIWLRFFKGIETTN